MISSFFRPLGNQRQIETQIKHKKVSMTYLFLFLLSYIQYSNTVLFIQNRNLNSVRNLIAHIKIRNNV